uniref:C2 domain-containing protein n=1 Tax=Ciona savignyi TaxID=51511 RepID=H2YIL2_CIOSA
MLFTKHGLFISCFCVIVLGELTAANLVSNLNWICEESAPCIRAIRPHGGVGEVSESTDRYTLLIGVHRRQTAEEDVMNGWSDGGAEPTWNVDVRWFRFLETRMRVLLPTCRNKLSCDVRLLGKNDVETDSETTHVFSHFIVEVRFDGHPSITRLKLVVRRNFGGNKKESKEGDGDDDFDSMLSANRGPKDPIKNKPQVTRPSPNVVVGNDGIYKPALTDEKPRISSPELNEEIKSHPNYGAMFNTGDTSDEKAGETGLSFHIQKDETDDYTNIIEWKGSKPNNSTND